MEGLSLMTDIDEGIMDLADGGPPKLFACRRCPKRYSRQDYLDRHSLNRAYHHA
jgi:uncharacterized Zn-finger protein